MATTIPKPKRVGGDGPRPKRKPSYRRVKIHRYYTVDEASRALGRSKGTIRRWIKTDGLPAITDHMPHLILGRDLADYLQSQTAPRFKLQRDEWFCLKCKVPRRAALGMADFVPRTSTVGSLSALCETCSRMMFKAIATSRLPAFELVLDISFQIAPAHLNDVAEPTSCSDETEEAALA